VAFDLLVRDVSGAFALVYSDAPAASDLVFLDAWLLEVSDLVLPDAWFLEVFDLDQNHQDPPFCIPVDQLLAVDIEDVALVDLGNASYFPDLAAYLEQVLRDLETLCC